MHGLNWTKKEVHMTCKISYEHLTEAVVQTSSVKKVFLEISQNSQENTCARVSILIKCRPEACNCIKIETLAQVFSCNFCEISMNTFSYRTLPVPASDLMGLQFWLSVHLDYPADKYMLKINKINTKKDKKFVQSYQ